MSSILQYDTLETALLDSGRKFVDNVESRSRYCPAKSQKYYQRNRDTCIEMSKEYYKKHREEYLAYLRDYYVANRELLRKRNKLRYIACKNREIERMEQFVKNMTPDLTETVVKVKEPIPEPEPVIKKEPVVKKSKGRPPKPPPIIANIIMTPVSMSFK